jgi:heavy metal sensor kinase
MGAVLALFALGTLANIRQEQFEAVDLEIEAEARRFLEMLGRPGTRQDAADFTRFEPRISVAQLGPAGELLSQSPGMPADAVRSAYRREGIHDIVTPAGSWRIGRWNRDGASVVVAYDLQEVHDILRDLLLTYLVLLPFMAAVAGSGGWWLAGRALEPVRNLTAAAERIQPSQMQQRVDVPLSNDEISRLAIVLNDMLARLETSFSQSQRFAGDASHELRTPLTIMRGNVERLLHESHPSPAQETLLLSLQEEINRLDHITEHLLLLARFDAGKVPLQTEMVDFSALLSEALDDAELLAAARHIELTADVPGGLHVKGDHDHLRRLLLNLLHNAVAHNQPDGTVSCHLEKRANTLVLRIGNTGPGISLQERDRLFERFYQVDPSRTNRQGHGLGLSLCKEIVRTHRGEIMLSPDSRTGWTEFVVTLPAAKPQARP